MKRLLKWVSGIIVALLALPLLAVLALLVVANLDFGRRLIEHEANSLTGGMVQIEGLAGRFPNALTVGQVQVADARGPYVTISRLVLDWSPLRLLEKTVQIDLAKADHVDFSRLPVSESKTSSTGGSYNLPVRIDLRRLQVDHALIGPSIAGVAATLALSGSADLPTLTEGQLQLDVSRLDSPGHYAASGAVTAQRIKAAVTAEEPAKGLISSIAKLPDLGAVSVNASVDGPKNALATQVGISAGTLKASATGTVDLIDAAADLAVKAQAPAMAPAPGVAWQSIMVDAKVHGPFARADVNATANVDALEAAGSRIGALTAEARGNSGEVELHARAQDVHVPGPKPDTFAADPLTLDASVRLDATDRPITFALHHPLLSVDGIALTAGRQQVEAHLLLPDLAPLAAVGGTDIRGHADLHIQAASLDGATTAATDGLLAITGGMAPLPALIGPEGHVDMAGSLHGQDIVLSRLTVNGKALTVSAQGGMSDQVVKVDWAVDLADLSTVQPSLAGRLDAKGDASGKVDNLAVRADIGADLTAKGYSSGHLTAAIDASGLPGAPRASVKASGALLDAPLSLSLAGEKVDGTIKIDISQLSWKSLQAGGKLQLSPPAVIPVGMLHVDFSRLADLEPLLGRAIVGRAAATLDSDDKAARLNVTIRDTALPGTAAISKALLNATVTDPFGHPDIDASLNVDGVSAGPAKSMSAKMTAKGALNALGIAVAADAPDIAGGPAKLTTAGTVNAQDRTVALARMEADWRQQALKLLAPAKFSFADGVTMDRVRLGFRQAELAVSGRAGSKLDLTATLRNLPADIGAIVDSSLAADGLLTADVRLTGTSARPEGKIKLTAEHVRLRQGPGQALPAADLVTNVTLLGTRAQIDTKLTAGPSHASVTGSAPLAQGGPLDLKTNGLIDLVMLDPLLLAQGRRARGLVTLDAAVTGSTTAPSVRGTAELRKGDVTDFGLGAHITDLAATVQATGDTIRLASLNGKAGPGNLGGSGTIGLAGTMPIDLRFTANDARPLSSDLLTALIDANLSVKGEVKGDMQAGGTLHVRRADIRIPDKLPPSIAVLPVRDANSPPPPPPGTAPQTVIALNLTLEAPEQVFIRGRGLDAELGGTIHIRGTTAKPIPDGGLHLRRGTLSVVGTTLNFTEGTIDFSGGGLTDPSVHFVATSSTTTLVATLTVSGSAKDPKITLSSVPDMPQDEILAQLLFNTSTSKLSPFQLAEIAAALASLSGATGSFDPLESLRNTFGLDRLSVGSNSSGDPTLEAGRYVARGVYLGAKQSASGGGTQATVQVDLAKGLKLETSAGSGSTSATGSTSSADAASVGVTYQFEY